MELSGVTINDCYLMKSKFDEDEAFEYWSVHAIYSPSNFILLLAKKTSDQINPSHLEEIRKFSASLAQVKTRAFEVFIELGQYEDRIFMVFLEIQGTPLSQDRFALPICSYFESLNLVMELGESLRILEMEGMSHGWICPENVWLIPEAGANLKAREVYGTVISCLYERGDPRKGKYQKYYPQNISLSTPFQRDVYGLGMTFVILLAGNSVLSEQGNRRLIGNNILDCLKIPDSGRKVISDLLEVHTKYESMQDVLLDLSNLLQEKTRITLDYKQLAHLTKSFDADMSKMESPLDKMKNETSIETQKTMKKKSILGNVVQKTMIFIRNLFGWFKKKNKSTQKAHLEAVGEIGTLEIAEELSVVEQEPAVGLQGVEREFGLHIDTGLSSSMQTSKPSFLNIVRRKFEDYFLGDRVQVDWKERQEIRLRKIQYLQRKRNRKFAQKPEVESRNIPAAASKPDSFPVKDFFRNLKIQSETVEQALSFKVPEDRPKVILPEPVVISDQKNIQKEASEIHNTAKEKSTNDDESTDPDSLSPLPQNTAEPGMRKSWWRILLDKLKAFFASISKKR